MELKKGMYVRFKDNKSIQYIGKLININEYREPCFKYAIEVNWYDDYIFIGNKDIVGEPSFDIIDLIKTGDYVNGHKVINIIEADVCGDEELSSKKIIIEQSSPLAYNRTILSDEAIEDIVTKEEFEARKYVVERDK